MPDYGTTIALLKKNPDGTWEGFMPDPWNCPVKLEPPRGDSGWYKVRTYKRQRKNPRSTSGFGPEAEAPEKF